MPIKHPNLHLERINGAIPAWRGKISGADLQPICHTVRDGGGRLLALWGSDEREQGNGHGKNGAVDNETRHARSLSPTLPLVAGEGANESLRDAHANGFVLHVVLVNETGLVCLSVALSAGQPVYPDISRIFPVANRMQRAAYDLLGIYASESQDHRHWLRHAAWPDDSFPLRKDFVCTPLFNPDFPLPNPDETISHSTKPSQDDGKVAGYLPEGEGANVHAPAERGTKNNNSLEPDNYPFVQVEGQGVHEIPVGPVHAGIIEPGHFRFSVVGEKVLRLEERLGYTHKGIEKRFESMTLQQGARLAGRVSGDSTVAYAWAYAMAAESIANIRPPDRALWLRALFLERERIANHLGDLGYLGNDVAFSFGFAQFWILKEQVLRNNAALFGHRYLMAFLRLPYG